MGRCPGGGEDECALALVVADANTGRLNWLPVVNENGSSEKFSSESASEVGLDAHSLNEKGKLIWISGYGVLYENQCGKMGKPRFLTTHYAMTIKVELQDYLSLFLR